MALGDRYKEMEISKIAAMKLEIIKAPGHWASDELFCIWTELLLIAYKFRTNPGSNLSPSFSRGISS